MTEGSSDETRLVANDLPRGALAGLDRLLPADPVDLPGGLQDQGRSAGRAGEMGILPDARELRRSLPQTRLFLVPAEQLPDLGHGSGRRDRGVVPCRLLLLTVQAGLH